MLPQAFSLSYSQPFLSVWRLWQGHVGQCLPSVYVHWVHPSGPSNQSVCQGGAGQRMESLCRTQEQVSADWRRAVCGDHSRLSTGGGSQHSRGLREDMRLRAGWAQGPSLLKTKESGGPPRGHWRQIKFRQVRLRWPGRLVPNHEAYHRHENKAETRALGARILTLWAVLMLGKLSWTLEKMTSDLIFKTKMYFSYYFCISWGCQCFTTWHSSLPDGARYSQQCQDCSPPGSSVHEILQARILERVAIPFFRGSFRPRGWTQVSCVAGGFFTIWATRKAQIISYLKANYCILLFHTSVYLIVIKHIFIERAS